MQRRYYCGRLAYIRYIRTRIHIHAYIFVINWQILLYYTIKSTIIYIRAHIYTYTHTPMYTYVHKTRRFIILLSYIRYHVGSHMRMYCAWRRRRRWRQWWRRRRRRTAWRERDGSAGCLEKACGIGARNERYGVSAHARGPVEKYINETLLNQ